MNLTSLSDVKQAVNELELRPSKTLGQNFLIDRNVRDILLATADLSKRDHVVEIGSGLGVLTEQIVQKAGCVTAIEKDWRLFEFVRARLAGYEDFKILHEDFLDIDFDRIRGRGPAKVISNLPYRDGTRMLMDLSLAESVPDEIVVTVQREVGDRLIASEGKDYGLLSIWFGIVFHSRKIRRVSRTCFWPVPEVESVIIKSVKRRPLLPYGMRDGFHRFTKRVFQHRRKQLRTILSELLSPEQLRRLADEGLFPRGENARPQEMTVQEWAAFWKGIVKLGIDRDINT